MSPLIVWIVLWIMNTYSEFHVNIFSNNRDVKNVKVFHKSFFTRGIILKKKKCILKKKETQTDRQCKNYVLPPLAGDNNHLSHNNPCFQCNITIASFLVSHTCEIRFHVIGQSTVHTYFYAKILKHG